MPIPDKSFTVPVADIVPGSEAPEGVPQDVWDALPTIVERKTTPFAQVHRDFLIHLGGIRRSLDADEAHPNYPLKKVAKTIGIPTAELQRWENGGKAGQSPTLLQLERWTRALGFSYEFSITPLPDSNTTTAEDAIKQLVAQGGGIDVPDARVSGADDVTGSAVEAGAISDTPQYEGQEPI